VSEWAAKDARELGPSSSSEEERDSDSRLGFGEWERERKRFHRVVRGASTLMRRKKGRRLYMSRTVSFGMWSVTHLSRQRLVTNSSRASGLGKTCWAFGWGSWPAVSAVSGSGLAGEATTSWSDV